MAAPNGLALQRSDFDPFLFAGVGTEPNGSVLTVLSLLARLEFDPWSQAQRLANLPTKAAAEWLAECIATTPLAAESQDDARRSVQALVALLPAKTGIARVAGVLPLGHLTAAPDAPGALFGETPALRWTLIALIWTVLVVGAASGALHSNAPAQKTTAAPTLQGSQ